MKRFLMNFRRYKNKFFAITFASLGLLFFVGTYGIELSLAGPNFFSDWVNILNILIVGYVYLTILINNINNDDRAFRGISAFVFMITFTQILNFVLFLLTNFASMPKGGVGIAFFYFHVIFLIGQIALGICYYITSQGYFLGRYSFKRVRLFGILFAAAMFLELFFQRGMLLITLQGSGFVFDFFNFMLLFGLPFSECLYAVSVVFTFERLRRN